MMNYTSQKTWCIFKDETKKINFAENYKSSNMMTLLEAIEARHSVRRYLEKPLSQEIIEALTVKIREINDIAHLNIQLVTDEARAFKGVFAYGKFSGVRNYFVMAGRKESGLDERIGYYGEQLVLLAQSLGLNTCWVGLSYTKIDGTYNLASDEKIACYIALGYGETPGTARKSKTIEEVSNADESTPEWFKHGVEAALLAPTAVNQQKFFFEYQGYNKEGGIPIVKARRKFSIVGYTEMDLGIAKLHFEIGAKTKFLWAD